MNMLIVTSIGYIGWIDLDFFTAFIQYTCSLAQLLHWYTNILNSKDTVSSCSSIFEVAFGWFVMIFVFMEKKTNKKTKKNWVKTYDKKEWWWLCAVSPIS